MTFNCINSIDTKPVISLYYKYNAVAADVYYNPQV